jgi:hypothetical protein
MRDGVLIQEYLTGNVQKESVIFTNNGAAYQKAGQGYAFHGTTDYSKSQYVKDEVIHINTLEGAFLMLNRMVIGIYHYISLKYTQKYFNELSFRYNNRDIQNGYRFNLMSLSAGNRLTYNNLIAK